MTLDAYLLPIHRYLDESTNQILQKVPVLGTPYVVSKYLDMYELYRRHPIRSVELAQFIARSWGINEDIVKDPAIRDSLYSLVDYSMVRGASLFLTLEDAIKRGINITDDQLINIAREHGIDLLPVYYWKTFLQSLKPPSYKVVSEKSQDQQPKNNGQSKNQNQGNQ